MNFWETSWKPTIQRATTVGRPYTHNHTQCLLERINKNRKDCRGVMSKVKRRRGGIVISR